MPIYSALVWLLLPCLSIQSTAVVLLDNREYTVGSQRVIFPIHGRLKTKLDLITTQQILFYTIYVWQSAPKLFISLQHDQEEHCQDYHAQEISSRPARIRQTDSLLTVDLKANTYFIDNINPFRHSSAPWSRKFLFSSMVFFSFVRLVHPFLSEVS